VDDLPPVALLVRLWLGFAIGIVAVVSVAVVAAEAQPELPVALPAALAAAASIAAIVGVAAVDRTIAASPPDDDRDALTEFRTRAFLQVGIAEAPVLFAFALTFVLGPPWVAAIGGVGGIASLAVARPTPGRINRIEAAWRAAGRDVSVLRAAREQAPGLGADDQEHL